jgi:hypothetical protein
MYDRCSRGAVVEGCPPAALLSSWVYLQDLSHGSLHNTADTATHLNHRFQIEPWNGRDLSPVNGYSITWRLGGCLANAK